MRRFELITPDQRTEKFRGLCALGIMTKAPEAGKVKTRLTPPLTSSEAAELNICFLRDLSISIDVATDTAPARGVAIYTPIGKEAAYDDILPPRFLLIPQREETFGKRLEQALEDLLQAGFDSVCLINSDSPTVPAENFAKAANELAKPGDRVVLGPSDDGGYYLIGLKKLHRRMFEQIDWSTDQVLRQTLERAAEIGISIHQLSAGFDVDDQLTLRRLCEVLLTGGESKTAPNTQQFLRTIIDREGRDRIWPKQL